MKESLPGNFIILICCRGRLFFQGIFGKSLPESEDPICALFLCAVLMQFHWHEDQQRLKP